MFFKTLLKQCHGRRLYFLLIVFMKLKKRRLFKIFPKGSKRSHGENDLKKLDHSTMLSNFFTKKLFSRSHSFV